MIVFLLSQFLICSKTHKAESIHQGISEKIEVTSTDNATSVTSAPLKSAGGLAVAKTIYSKQNIISNTDADDWHELIRGNSNGTVHAYRGTLIKQYIAEADGTVLQVPFVSQSNLKVVHYLNIKGIDGKYNTWTPLAFTAELAFGSLYSLSDLEVLKQEGNIDTITTTSNNLLFTFKEGYENLFISIELLFTRPNYSVILDEIKLI